MTAEERYLFDLQGYLVVEDVLTEQEVGQLNALLDEYALWENKGQGRFQEFWVHDESFITVGPLHMWDEPFRNLLDHPKMLPYLTELLGADFRYDHGHALLMRKGAKTLRLHGGGTPFIPDSYYVFRDGKICNGLLAVSYALTDARPGEGGFAAVQGSHKSNLALPDEFEFFEKPGPWVVHVPARAGSAIIFTEALTHGTWPWKADHERRSLLYKYTPGHIAWAGFGADAKGIHLIGELPANGWTEQQQRILAPPYSEHRPDVVVGE